MSEPKTDVITDEQAEEALRTIKAHSADASVITLAAQEEAVHVVTTYVSQRSAAAQARHKRALEGLFE